MGNGVKTRNDVTNISVETRNGLRGYSPFAAACRLASLNNAAKEAGYSLPNEDNGSRNGRYNRRLDLSETSKEGPSAPVPLRFCRFANTNTAVEGWEGRHFSRIGV